MDTYISPTPPPSQSDVGNFFPSIFSKYSICMNLYGQSGNLFDVPNKRKVDFNVGGG